MLFRHEPRKLARCLAGKAALVTAMWLFSSVLPLVQMLNCRRKVKQERRRGSNKKQRIQTFNLICVTDFLFVWETWLDNVVAVRLGCLGMHPTHTPKPHILLAVCHVEIREAIAREKCSFFEHCSKGL